LTEPISSHVLDATGPVHAGGGDQYNWFAEQASSRTRIPRTQAADDLRWLAQRFVHPGGFGRARGVLAAQRTVFLDAPSGSGRLAAAKMLLWELAPDAEKFHQLLIQEKDHESRIDPRHIVEGDRAWLDLSETAEPDRSEIHDELPSLRREVHDRGAYLVVLMPQDAWGIHPELGQYRVQIERPAAREVLRRHLMMEDFPQPDILPPLAFLDEDRPLRDFARYVSLIQEARAMADAEGGFLAWCATAYQALSDRTKEISDLIDRLDQGPQRALLLSAAMLHGAHADSVHHASTLLLQVVKDPVDGYAALRGTALRGRLEAIKAKSDASGKVTFTELGYDSAIRSYFWANFPELHEHLRVWVGKAVDSCGLTDDERESLARRFAELCLAERYQSSWVPLVEQWTSQYRRSGMKAAIAVLRCGIEDEENARLFRRKIYAWSTTDGLQEGLAEAIVVACRDYMAISQADEALVRLHHVARREHRTHAQDALLGLATQDRRFFRQLMGRITDTSPDRRRWEADIGLFLELADPGALTEPGEHGRALIAENYVRRQMAVGWDRAFSSVTHETWSPRATQWLDRAAQDDRHRDRLIAVLIEGGASQASVLARLYVLAHGRPSSAAIGNLVLAKINSAQGIRVS
jgi:hypothetical protein